MLHEYRLSWVSRAGGVTEGKGILPGRVVLAVLQGFRSVVQEIYQ